MRYIAAFRGRGFPWRHGGGTDALVTVAGVIVYLAAHRGREISAHMIDTDAPGYVPPAPSP